jgi:hypothetical protein
MAQSPAGGRWSGYPKGDEVPQPLTPEVRNALGRAQLIDQAVKKLAGEIIP